VVSGYFYDDDDPVQYSGPRKLDHPLSY
jgi:hypothetical protein